jgi:biotin transporter BioY
MTARSFFWWPVKWILAGYILSYLMAAFLFSISGAQQNKTSVVFVLWSFVVLHTAYGLGSLWAIITIPVKFPDHNKRVSGKPLADRKV